jgi:hypothetical protein
MGSSGTALLPIFVFSNHLLQSPAAAPSGSVF